LKILLDENMPHQLRGHLPNHDVSTAVYVGFGGFTNGELLQAAKLRDSKFSSRATFRSNTSKT